jgi:hypothetical protein
MVGGREVKVMATLEDRGGKTLLSLRMLVGSAGQLEAMKKFGAVEGGTQTLDRLEHYLAGMLRQTLTPAAQGSRCSLPDRSRRTVAGAPG